MPGRAARTLTGQNVKSNIWINLDQCVSLYSSCIDSYPVDLLDCYRLPIILVQALQKR